MDLNSFFEAIEELCIRLYQSDKKNLRNNLTEFVQFMINLI
jgi:hypothetical protein